MKEVRIAASERPFVMVKKLNPVLNPGARFTLGPFFKETGILIGKLLCLALLAKILVMMALVH